MPLATLAKRFTVTESYAGMLKNFCVRINETGRTEIEPREVACPGRHDAHTGQFSGCKLLEQSEVVLDERDGAIEPFTPLGEGGNARVKPDDACPACDLGGEGA